MPKLIDLTGHRFGRLTVVKRSEEKRSKPHWECRCDCGNATTVYAWALRSGAVRSCGCLNIESLRARATIHGASKSGKRTPEYTAWMNMRRRCYGVGRPDYCYYGGRGIGVCPEWRDDFQAFLRDMGPRPFAGASIDRINPNGDYSPQNCRWATRTEQARNMRKTCLVTWRGETRPLTEWCEQLGIKVGTLYQRIYINHEPVEQAMTAPLHSGRRI